MRTTLTLDDDVAVQIERLRKERDLNLKDVVNEALRRGLSEMQRPPVKRKPFRTQPITGAVPTLCDVDNIAEVIALAEGEFFK